MLKLKDLLLEALTLNDAEEIFKQFGVPNARSLSADDLKAAYKTLILKHHPDKNPPEDKHEKDIEARLINSAYDVLKLQRGEPRSGETDDEYWQRVWRWRNQGATDPEYDAHFERTRQERERRRQQGRQARQRHEYPGGEGYEQWAQAGWSGGMPNSSHGANMVGNVNYYKKKAWEISGKPPCTEDNEYTLWNWDGNYFRGAFSVFATPSKLYEISHMMIDWDDFKSVAVFYTKKIDTANNVIHLVNLRGQKISLTYVYESFNRNPGNDQNFVSMLRRSYPPQ